MTTITVQSPVKVVAPRAARLAATAFMRVLNWLEHSGATRAEKRLEADRANEAAAVRDYALRFADHDPRFAADLLAAADRHERAL